MANQSKPKRLSVAELRAHPATARLKDLPSAEKLGHIDIGKGKSFKIGYRIHGHGPIKILWLCGHGMSMRGYREVMEYFGTQHGDTYTSLFVDNRGIGESEAPWSLINPKLMASDCIEVLDKLGWTSSEKSFHLAGFSMGGMIAQEVALLIPANIISLILLATTSRCGEGRTLKSNWQTIAPFLTAWSEDARLEIIMSRNVSKEWREAPDPKGEFPSQGDRWLANVLNSLDSGSSKGELLSMLGLISFNIPAEQSKQLADNIGRRNILIMQGTGDQTLQFEACKVMLRAFGGVESGVQTEYYEGAGHCFIEERPQEVFARLAGFLTAAQEAVRKAE